MRKYPLHPLHWLLAVLVSVAGAESGGPAATARATFLGAPFEAQGLLAETGEWARYAWDRLYWQAVKWWGQTTAGPPPPPDDPARRYARNVWDMQLWQGKIYLGHGNSNNRGPAPNAGPVPVIYYDPAAGRFATEFAVDEEQIDRYRVIGGQLYIPGHDPRDPWDWGNFYRRGATGWEKMRTIPLAIHTYDMLPHQGALFAATGTTAGAAVWRSADGGHSWERFALRGTPRAYELFVLAGTLYVSAYKGRIYRFTGDGFERAEMELFPGMDRGPHPLAVRTTPLGGTLLYLGAERAGDHQWTPLAAYAAERPDQARLLDLPAGDRPCDIIAREGKAYILANRRTAGTGTTVVIYGSQDLHRWAEVARFAAPGPARSFEYYRGQFYVGLGTERARLHPASGHIYQVIP